MNEAHITHQIDLDDFDCFLQNEVADLPSRKLAAKLMALTRGVNPELCQGAHLVQLENGEWFLRWEERHLEMVSHEEFLTSDGGQRLLDPQATRGEWQQLNEAMPPKHFELSITRQQAFALFVAHNLVTNDEFDKEHAAMLDTLCGSL